MKLDAKTAAARAFVRSLNILLKFARLYGYDHDRTIQQLQVAMKELRAAVPAFAEQGLLLGATGSQLLLDGVPLDGSPAERQFAQLLSAAGLASVQFFPEITQDELARFARAFPTGKAKPSELALQLKAAIGNARGIRVNEICFVATDSRLKEASMAAQLAMSSLGADHDQFKAWLNDPHKLLELIAAAEGSKGSGAKGSGAGTGSGEIGGGGAAIGTGSGQVSAYAVTPGVTPENAVRAGAPAQTSGPGTSTAESSGSTYSASSLLASGELSYAFDAANFGAGGSAKRSVLRTGDPSEDEILGILGALTSFGQIGSGQGSLAAANAFQHEVAELPGNAQDTLKQALAGLAAQAPEGKPDESVLVKLAEHLAIRYALERYEKGEVKVNAVRQMLDRMNQEIQNLRNILGSHEDKMTEAGMMVETHREILDRQFWAAVPESGKREVLLSNEAWCIPPRNVQSYVAELMEKGDVAEAISILQNYASCADSEEVDARKRAALGLSELAELYAKADPRILGDALRHVGVRLNVEQDAELQGLVSAAFVRLSQQAAASRCYSAMEQALDLVVGVESQRPGIARDLRSKMGIEERVPEFVEEALKARQAAAGLTSVLRMMPNTAMEQIASKFNRCVLRDDSEHIANLAMDLGEEGLQYLRSTVRGGSVTEVVEMVGLLSKLDAQAVIVFLPGRMKQFPRAAQDRMIRQISSANGPHRCRILMELIDYVDPLLMPLVIDEIGVTADRDSLGRLLTIVDGDLPIGGGPYLQVKAIEALGRMHAPEAVRSLMRIAEAKKMFGWQYPQEMRIAAIQALEKLDPGWAQNFKPKSGLEQQDLMLAPLDVAANSKFVRQRRHARVRLQKPVTAVSTNLKENCRLEIKTASLSGGVATIDRHMKPGTHVQLKMQLGLRSLQATALLRDYRAQDIAFEIVDMPLEERMKLRRLLADNLGGRVSEPVPPAPLPEPAGKF